MKSTANCDCTLIVDRVLVAQVHQLRRRLKTPHHQSLLCGRHKNLEIQQTVTFVSQNCVEITANCDKEDYLLLSVKEH